MKLFIKIFLFTLMFWFAFSGVDASDVGRDKNLNTWNISWKNRNNNDKLNQINANGDEYSVSKGWVQGLQNTLIQVASSMKNVLYAIATIYFLILVLRLILTNNTEEEIGNFKKGVLWITIGLIITQIAFSFVDTFFDNWVSWALAERFIGNVLNPLIALLETMASAFFVAIAIFTFYRMITANGEDEKVTKWKQSIIYAIVWFIVVKLAKVLVITTYWKIDCGTKIITTTCVRQENLSDFVLIIVDVINWMNSFIGIVVVLMIIYAGAQILLSGGDEEKVSKAKKAIIGVFIGLLILVFNYLILTFFIIPESTI